MLISFLALEDTKLLFNGGFGVITLNTRVKLVLQILILVKTHFLYFSAFFLEQLVREKSALYWMTCASGEKK